jgi:hypothetical protein
MRPLHLREWPIFHALWKLSSDPERSSEGATTLQVLRALAEEQVADRHSVRAVLEGFVADGYARSETHHERQPHEEPDQQSARIEIVTYYPLVSPEDALRTAWPQLRELMLDHGRYLELFRGLVGGEG